MKIKTNTNLIRALYIIGIIVLYLIRPDSYSDIDEGYLYTISVIFLCAVIVHFLEEDKSNWLRIDVFFILGFAIVHFQWPIMYSFSNILPEKYWAIFVDDRLVNYTTWLSAIGGLCFLLGFHLFSRKKKTIPKPLPPVSDYSNLIIATAISFVVFLLFAGSNFLTGGVYKGEGGSAAGGGISKYVFLVFNVCLIISTVLIVYQSKHKYKGNLLKWFLGLNKIYLGIVLIYIPLFLTIGDRGGPLTLILTLLILIGSFVRKFRFIEVFVIVFVGGVVMTIIGLGRSEASGIEIFEVGSEKLVNSTGYDVTIQLANSVRTVNAAAAHVPNEHDYFYGSLWVAAVLSPIPFAQSAYSDKMELQWYEIDSSNYITYLVLGKYPTWGLGTSLIADIYINFGVVGIVFFMFVLGMFLKKLTIELKNPSSYKWLIVAATVAGVSLYYARSTYLMSVRDIAWGILFFTLLVSVQKRKAR